MTPCVLLLLNMGLITPSYGRLELPWRASWLWQLLVDFPGVLRCLEATQREVFCHRSYGVFLLTDSKAH